MKRLSLLKSVVLASGFAAVLVVSTSPALAQPKPALTQAAVAGHQADLEAMLADLAKVQNADTAKSYEGYLSGQLPKYIANHKTLHHGALVAINSGATRRNASAEQQKLADAADKLSETHFPKLAQEMARVEKLNPGLKKQFDQLRTLD